MEQSHGGACLTKFAAESLSFSPFSLKFKGWPVRTHGHFHSPIALSFSTSPEIIITS